MLVHLSISDFAIISHLEINLRPGLNILSGETGAGKSIIISAVNLILGGRSSVDLIRSGAEEARVEALFNLPENASIGGLLSEMGIPFEGEVLIKRIISRAGKNKVMINDSLVTLQMLSRVGGFLISISGQHEHQVLLRPDHHLYLLDDLGGLTDERLALSESFGRWQALKEDRSRLERKLKSGEERQELARFQMEEIEKADLGKGEDRLLEEEKKRLQNAEQVMQAVGDAYEVLYEKDDALLSRLSLCVRDLTRAAELDGRLEGVRDALASAKVELEETALDLRDFQHGIVIDPYRLEEVEERLQLINGLKRKYGPSLAEIRAFQEGLSRRVGNLSRERETLDRLGEKIVELEGRILSRAEGLSRKRKKVAGELERAVTRELDLLSMGGTRFEVDFHEAVGDSPAADNERRAALRADGLDKVEFMLSTNVGEDLKPLSRIASGGELSRIMLALKTILARTGSVETIIFDEVDAGIGGATAEVVGEKIQSLAGYHQLLCISHLPQIASKGGTHFLVEKEVVDGRTQTLIMELDKEERVKEIARLLGGKVITRRAVDHAREMLERRSRVA